MSKRNMKHWQRVNDLHICPKCKGMKKDPFDLDGKKIFRPRWKVVVKERQWECRNCGYVKEVMREKYLKEVK